MSDLKIQDYEDGGITIFGKEHLGLGRAGGVSALNAGEVRELIVWLWKNKTTEVREVVCENCPEVC
jgi:hypothetical protein